MLNVLRISLAFAMGMTVLVMAPVVPAQDNLGAVEVPVADNSAAARDDALVEALDALLVRLTGQPDIVRSAVAERLRGRVSDTVNGFSYRSVEVDDGDQAERETRLRVRFSRTAIRNALARDGVAVWPPSPPTVLVWLGAQRDGERFIAGSDRGEALLDALEAAARPLGIRPVAPLMDLQDRRNLGFADIAGGFVEPVRAASERYGADAVLMGRLQQGAGREDEVRWTLLPGDGEPVQRWRTRAASLEAVMAAGARGLAERLRQSLAYVADPDSRRQLTVSVDGIDSLAAHQAVAARLGELVGVTRVIPAEVGGDRVRWRLAIGVDAGRVERALAADPRLQPTGDGYRWRQ
ncbi:hypothetical protein BBH56_01660 [Spiribacter roseus]|nr:hypothetical protein BBH56_01660 [Spiribacter roseus]